MNLEARDLLPDENSRMKTVTLTRRQKKTFLRYIRIIYNGNLRILKQFIQGLMTKTPNDTKDPVSENLFFKCIGKQAC